MTSFWLIDDLPRMQRGWPRMMASVMCRLVL